MTDLRDGKVAFVTDAAAVSTVDAVRRAVLDLLAVLPERPERLRMRMADVTVELDWRSPPVQVPVPVPSSPVAVPAVSGENAAGGPVAGEPRQLSYICAPTIGTFYHAPEPGASPFVTEGATVGPGQQVGIVEAMKLMLPVEADQVGRVVEVLAANGAPVEYGERLLAIGPVE